MGSAIFIGVVLVFALIFVFRLVKIVSQAQAGVVERLGRYHRTLNPGLNLVMPFVDRVKPMIDLREQVVAFPPQPVITQDNLVVSIDTVLYFTIIDPKAATYEVANPLQAIEQLTVTTLRNVIGSLDLEQALTSRDDINGQLRGSLDEATGPWGIRINRVELKSIDPPATVQEAMEKQMRAERDRRAVILTAEGQKQNQILTAQGFKESQVLTAEGERQAAILRAEGEAQATVLRAQAEATAIENVNRALHQADLDSDLLLYQYLQMMPKLAENPANKVFLIPQELSGALSGLMRATQASRGSGGDLDLTPSGE